MQRYPQDNVDVFPGGRCRWSGPRDRTPVLIVLAFALAMVLVHALAVPNVGTMYRMRYAGWQLANGLGALGWAALLARR